MKLLDKINQKILRIIFLGEIRILDNREIWRKFLKEQKDKIEIKRGVFREARKIFLFKRNLERIKKDKLAESYMSQMVEVLKEDPCIIYGAEQPKVRTRFSDRTTVSEQRRRYGLQETSEEHWKHCSWNPNREKEVEQPTQFKVGCKVRLKEKKAPYCDFLHLTDGVGYTVLEVGSDQVLIVDDLKIKNWYHKKWFVLYLVIAEKNEKEKSNEK
jgi:hypothetical protein